MNCTCTAFAVHVTQDTKFLVKDNGEGIGAHVGNEEEYPPLPHILVSALYFIKFSQVAVSPYKK